MQVLTVVIAAALAFVSKWLLDGGLRRRDRVTIREEIELANLIQTDDVLKAGALRSMAEARLAAYVRPRWWEKLPASTIGVAVAFLCFGIAMAVLGSAAIWHERENITPAAIAAAAAIATVTVVTVSVIEQFLRARRISREMQRQRVNQAAVVAEYRASLDADE